jgi:hypothetical protein
MLQQHVGTTGAASGGGRRPNVRRWARVAAYVVPLLTVPSGLWRLALALDVPGMPDPGQPAGQRLYVVFLSLLAEGLALLTLGLVQPWGEVLPRWIRLLGGRRIPPLAAVIPAALGAAAVTTIVAYAASSGWWSPATRRWWPGSAAGSGHGCLLPAAPRRRAWTAAARPPRPASNETILTTSATPPSPKTPPRSAPVAARTS